MTDLPPAFPESTDPAGHSDVPQSVQPVDEFGNSFEIPEFKEVPFLNGLFVTLLVTLIFSEISVVVTTVLKIHALDDYYSEISKIRIIDPNHWHARSELATANAASGIVSLGCLLFLTLASICMLFWMFRNYKNSIALAGGRLKYSAEEATAGLAIPFVSLARPYFAVVEMVKIAKDRLNWDSVDAPAYVHLWWLFNIAAIVVGLITRIITFSIPEPVRSYIWNYAWVLVYALAVFKNLSLIRIILVVWDGGRRQGQLGEVIGVEPPSLEGSH
jgi:uncharacterized protein DUF4328